MGFLGLLSAYEPTHLQVQTIRIKLISVSSSFTQFTIETALGVVDDNDDNDDDDDDDDDDGGGGGGVDVDDDDDKVTEITIITDNNIQLIT